MSRSPNIPTVIDGITVTEIPVILYWESHEQTRRGSRSLLHYLLEAPSGLPILHIEYIDPWSDTAASTGRVRSWSVLPALLREPGVVQYKPLPLNDP